jgi:beta-mannosidase
MKRNLLLASVLILLTMFSACNPAKHKITVDISKGSWFFHQKDSDKILKAKVPGSVHMDLLRNGEIPDPYYRDNEEKLQWIGERDWVYETEFDVSREIIGRENLEMVFKGLDTYADVYLNDSLILKADNFFREWVVDVKSLLKDKGNKLVVSFTAPGKIEINKKASDDTPLEYLYSYTRKPAYHYGWDWGPVFVTQGIWKPVLIEAWDNARLNDVQMVQSSLNDEKAELKFVYEVEADKDIDVTVSAECDNTGKKEEKTFNVKKGINKLEFPFTVDKPKRWWSHGLGEPYLYTFSFDLKIDGNVIDSRSDRAGLRTLKLVQKPDSVGKTFYFELNGVPVFMKGANYIPQDMFLNRPTPETYETTIKNAVDANMNMLRVWGGGFYENDIFYDLCDENGLLVWQDFMYACAMYPGDDDFLNNVKEETIQNVKRLRNHPSIALWCGNNENYIGWQDWRWSDRYSKEDSAKVWHDYEKLFHKLIPDVIKEYDPGRDYWPSSPLFGWGYPVNTEGDVHYWGIWHAQEPFENFKKPEFIGRFMSEYGFQSLPEMSSIKKFTLPEDRDISSKVMKMHQKHRIGYPVIDKYMKWYYRWPKDFEAYVYVSQLLQSFGIDMAIETHRRSMPHCMGTLYWQLNDCYPVASWASVDVYNKWKALHYKVRDIYKEVLVSPDVEDGKLNVYVVSDALQPKEAGLMVRLYDFNGKLLKENKENVTIKPNASRIYFSVNADKYLRGIDKRRVVLVAEVKEGEKQIAQNHFFFVYPKDLNLRKADITLSSEKISDGYRLTLTTDKFAKEVFLSTDDGNGFFTKNFFDLIPGRPVTLVYETDKKTENIKDFIHIYSLVDSYD